MAGRLRIELNVMRARHGSKDEHINICRRTPGTPNTIVGDSKVEQCFGFSCPRKGSPGCALKSGWVSAQSI